MRAVVETYNTLIASYKHTSGTSAELTKTLRLGRAEEPVSSDDGDVVSPVELPNGK